MTPNVRRNDNPVGWIVGPDELKIHIFRPDMGRAKIEFLDRKSQKLVRAVLSQAEDVQELQVRSSLQ